jgi:hypothetical protein
MKVTPDFPPKAVIDDPGGSTGGSKYWVEAFGVDIAQDDGPKATEITFYVCSDVKKTSKNISVRYYFDSTGMTSLDPNSIEMRQLYDQTAAETEYEAELSGPHLYKDKVYYIEISWPNYVIANSNKKYQFALGTYAWQNYWNPEDDWSHQGLSLEDSNWTGKPVKTDNICVYDAGVLVGGTEPDGTTPVVTTPTPTTSTPTPTPVSDVLVGDVNGDGNVNSIDFGYFRMYLLGTIKEFPAENDLKAADVNGDGNINSIDFGYFRMLLLGTIKEFPAAK